MPRTRMNGAAKSRGCSLIHRWSPHGVRRDDADDQAIRRSGPCPRPAHQNGSAAEDKAALMGRMRA